MGVSRRWLTLLRLPTALLGIWLFFPIYNRYIVDSNLKNLKSSLSFLEKASGIEQAEVALLLVDQTLVAQMVEEELQLERVAALQYSQGTLSTGKADRPVNDVRTLVAVSWGEQKALRPGFLVTLDRAVSGTEGVFRQIVLLPRRLFGRSLSSEIDLTVLHKAIQHERMGQLFEAIDLLEKLLSDYPNYTGRDHLKLRLGYLYQRVSDFKLCLRYFQQVAQESSNPSLVELALVSLRHIPEIEAQQFTIQKLQERLVTLELGPERQRAAFELGNLLIKSYRFQTAASTFRLAREAFPEGGLTVPCLFKEGWCLKYMGKTEEAMDRFQEVIQKAPKSRFAQASFFQIAELYKASGDRLAAAQAYEQALAQDPKGTLASLAHAFAGSTYLFDLNDPQKAQEHFQTLGAFFPASPFSVMGERLIRVPPDRKPVFLEELPPSIATGIPFRNLIETYLPLFVRVFADRIAKYMEATQESELTRNYSEEEFRELVVRRVQQLLPGRITEVVTKIRSDGYFGSGTIHLGILSLPIEGRVGIVVVDKKCHVEIHEVRVSDFPLPKGLLKAIEIQVNKTIAKEQYPILVHRYELKPGYAFIQLELVKKE